jgi:hypothetical protein
MGPEMEFPAVRFLFKFVGGFRCYVSINPSTISILQLIDTVAPLAKIITEPKLKMAKKSMHELENALAYIF